MTITQHHIVSHDTPLTVASSQCSMNSARLSMVCVISGMLCCERACLRLDTMSSWCAGRSSIQHDTNAALNNSLEGTERAVSKFEKACYYLYACIILFHTSPHLIIPFLTEKKYIYISSHYLILKKKNYLISHTEKLPSESAN